VKAVRGIMILVLVALLTAAFVAPASATAQWSRKYKLSCQTCHSAFPRLNYYGQRFMRNGYQDPDSTVPDGDEKGKTELNDITFIDKIGNLLGVRLNVNALQYRTNVLEEVSPDEGVDNEVTDQLSLGSTGWVQLFVAGSIAENKSIFIEMEFTDEKYHYSWYKFGFHNLFDTSLANVIVGNVPARDYGAYPNRLRIMGPVKGDVFGIKSSQGARKDTLNEAALNASGSRPGIQYYGYQGPVLVWGGVSPGDNGETKNIGLDFNDKIHYWGGLRLEVTEEMGLPIEGSAVSAWYYKGTDTSPKPKLAPGRSQEFGPASNDYTRMSFETEIRAGDFEVMAAYLVGKDENWDLHVDEDEWVEVEYSGISVVGGYMQETPVGLMHYCLQYDSVTSDDVSDLEVTYVTPSISFFPRENIRIGLYGRFDMTDGREDDKKKHDIFLNIRTMF
jgi:hypothetical protein